MYNISSFQAAVDNIFNEKALEFRRHYDEPSEQAMQSIFGNISKEELRTTISVFTRLNKNVDELKGRMEAFVPGE